LVWCHFCCKCSSFTITSICSLHITACGQTSHWLIPHWSCPNPTTQYLCHSVIVTQCPVYCSWCIFWPQSSAGRTRKPSSMPALFCLGLQRILQSCWVWYNYTPVVSPMILFVWWTVHSYTRLNRRNWSL
jgi:hypothetical protein